MMAASTTPQNTALPGFMVISAAKHGWLAASFNLFDVSAIVWLAIIAGFVLLWRAEDDAAPEISDWLCAGLAISAALIPVPPVSGVMLT